LSVVLLLSVGAFAQDFELDLTEEKPKVPDELKPSIAVLSVLPGDGDEVSLGRARQLETELNKHLVQVDSFKTVIEPAVTARMLGASAEASKKCLDYACFDAAAKALKVDRAVRVTVTRAGVGSIVTVYGFDPGFNEVLKLDQDSGEKAEKAFLGMTGKSQAQKDRDFLKKVSPFVKDAVSKLATANGKITVDNVDSNIAVLVDNVEAGTGSFEVVVPRGSHTVKVNADGYLPFEKSVTVEELKTVGVQISLVAKEIAVTKAPMGPQGTSFFARPGLYIALAGAIAAGVGVAFGQSAAAVNRTLATGGVVALTRSQAKAGVTQALLANILVSVGAAAMVGGVTWVILTPSFGGASGDKPKVEPTESTNVNGFVLEFGGRF
jgi:hypothetical protein